MQWILAVAFVITSHGKIAGLGSLASKSISLTELRFAKGKGAIGGGCMGVKHDPFGVNKVTRMAVQPQDEHDHNVAISRSTAIWR